MRDSGRRRRITGAGLAALAIVVALTACSSSGSGGGSSSGSSGSAAGGKNLAGQTITVWAANDPFMTPLAPLVKKFEAQTGATVHFNILGNETAYYAKLQLGLASHSGPDIWFGPTPLIGQYASLGAVPLSSFLSNSKETPASWNYSDFPQDVTAQCGLNGDTYCLPVESDTTMLYYNKAQFKAAGISGPPQSMAQLVTDAAKLNTPQHAGFCMRATVDQSNYFTGQMMLLYYLNYKAGNQGTFLNPSWQPQLTTPQATSFANTFKKLEVQYGPKGIAGYGYQECETDLNQGKVSMFWETDAFASAVNNPSISNQAKNIGYTVIPCPPSSGGHCTMGSPWGIYLNKTSKVQPAAWQLMQFLTSESSEKAVVATGQATVALRKSVSATAFTGSNPLLPKAMGTAISYGLAHLDPHPFPPLPNLIQVLTPFGQALSDIVSGQSSVEKAMNQANSQATQVLKTAGKLH
jgi:ABC-type glycerol-3-phosphate transport system substrate-binding protein